MFLPPLTPLSHLPPSLGHIFEGGGHTIPGPLRPRPISTPPGTETNSPLRLSTVSPTSNNIGTPSSNYCPVTSLDLGQISSREGQPKSHFVREEVCPRYLVGDLIHFQMSLLGSLSLFLLRSPNTLSHQASQLWTRARRSIQDPSLPSRHLGAPACSSWIQGAALSIGSAGSSALVWPSGEAHLPFPAPPFLCAH